MNRCAGVLAVLVLISTAGCTVVDDRRWSAEELLAHVPPEVMWQPSADPTGREALEEFESGAALLNWPGGPLADPDSEEDYEDLFDEDAERLMELIWDISEAGVSFPDDETGEELGTWLDSNTEAMEKLRRVARRERIDLSPSGDDPSEVLPNEVFGHVSRLSDLFGIAAKRDIARGDLVKARENIRTLFDFGALLQRSTTGSLVTVVGSGHKSVALELVAWMARHAALRETDLAELRALIDEQTEEADVFGEALRIELCGYFIPYVARECQPLQLDDWIGETMPSFWKEEQRADVDVMLGSHDDLFDIVDTVTLAGETARRQVSWLRSSWKDRPEELPEIVETISAWPKHLSGNWFFGLDSPLLSDGDAATAGAKLARVSNPMGRFAVALASESNAEAIVGAHYSAIALKTLVRTQIALRVHRLRTGSFPDHLEELVAAGLLESLPVDPFSGEPVGYSAEDEWLWSVGRNGVTDPIVEEPTDEEIEEELEGIDTADDLVEAFVEGDFADEEWSDDITVEFGDLPTD